MANSISGTDAVQMHFFYDAQGRPMLVRYNGTDYAYQHNLQGDIVGIVDMSGATVVEYGYDAWGKPISTEGSMAGTLGYDNPFRYRGYVWDEETGLYYLRSRYYDPEMARFLNADLLLGHVATLGSHNLFAYCKNSPVMNEDLDGRSPLAVPLLGTGPVGWIVLGLIVLGTAYYSSKLKSNKPQSSSKSKTGAAPSLIIVSSVSEGLSVIADQYKNLECVEAAEAMQDVLKQLKQNYSVIEITFTGGRGFVWSNKKGKVISENGFHVGVSFEDIVYCNVHPLGLSEDQWVADFEGTGVKNVVKTDY